VRDRFKAPSVPLPLWILKLPKFKVFGGESNVRAAELWDNGVVASVAFRSAPSQTTSPIKISESPNVAAFHREQKAVGVADIMEISSGAGFVQMECEPRMSFSQA